MQYFKSALPFTDSILRNDMDRSFFGNESENRVKFTTWSVGSGFDLFEIRFPAQRVGSPTVFPLRMMQFRFLLSRLFPCSFSCLSGFDPSKCSWWRLYVFSNIYFFCNYVLQNTEKFKSRVDSVARVGIWKILQAYWKYFMHRKNLLLCCKFQWSEVDYHIYFWR